MLAIDYVACWQQETVEDACEKHSRIILFYNLLKYL
jgi:hypothetical protein